MASGRGGLTRGTRARGSCCALAGRPWTPSARIRGMHQSASARGAGPRLPRIPDQRRLESRELRARPRTCRDVRQDLAWRVDERPGGSRGSAERPPRTGFRRRTVAARRALRDDATALPVHVVARPGVGRRPPGDCRCIRCPETAGRLCGRARAGSRALRRPPGYGHRPEQRRFSICFRPGTIGSTAGCSNPDAPRYD